MSDHPALQHLQITFTPDEYRLALTQHSVRGTVIKGSFDRDFLRRLPNYVYSRCPYCGAPYTGILDTHSLSSDWVTSPSIHSAVYSDEWQKIGCWHFVAVQTFINLCGLAPTDLVYFKNALDVPFVMPIFVPDDVAACAVIHSLPICRIENGGFVPRYSVYMVTYYSQQPKLLWFRRHAEMKAEFAKHGDPEMRLPKMYSSWEATQRPGALDLRAWVAKQKLQWLDVNRPDLPLKSGPVEEFPYGSVTGYLRPYTVRNSQLKFSY
jgi:hypothetical protein